MYFGMHRTGVGGLAWGVTTFVGSVFPTSMFTRPGFAIERYISSRIVYEFLAAGVRAEPVVMLTVDKLDI